MTILHKVISICLYVLNFCFILQPLADIMHVMGRNGRIKFEKMYQISHS